MPYISRSKSNQKMKFGNFVEHNMQKSFLQKLCRKWEKETSSRPHFLRKWFILHENIFASPRLGDAIKINYKISDCLSRDMFEKGLGLVSLTRFVFDFSRKIFHISHSIKWSTFIIWLPLLLEILDNMCIVIICFPVYDARNFENSLSFFIRACFYMNKKLRTKVLRWNKTLFSSFLKGFQLQKIVSHLKVVL